MSALYDALEIPTTATPAEIRKAFRNKSRKAHPDGEGSKEEMQRLSEAYHVLIDPVRRKQYDETGSTAEFPSALGLVSKMVIQLISETLGAGKDPECIDLLAVVKARIEEEIGTLDTKCDQLEKLVAKFKKVAKRLTSKKGKDNLLVQSLMAHIGMLENHIKAIPAEKHKLEECLEFLKDYKYNAEKEKFVGWGGAYVIVSTS